jgi:wobble nucleotide-excising tRNase
LYDITEELASAFKEIESVINKHNSKVDSFEVEKQQAKGKLLNHFAAEFIKEKKYFDSQGKIKETEGEIQNLSSEIDKVNEKIEKINSQIKAETIGANKINEYLRQFFNDDKLRIETTDDSKYKIYRDDYIAKNLSTGEKNIISLVYFFAKLEETHFNFRNAVIFIDDPVSSLDSNHIFKVYGFISEKLRDCGQLFITTHNFDFFNLLKDLGNKVSGDKVRYYIVKKVRDQTGEFSYIENLPAVLLKYKSEYNYLFSIVKSYRESKDKSNFGLLYLLPNVLRRFFEAYLFMKYPDGREFKKKIETFLKDKNISDKQKVLKLMDEYSHEEDPTHSQKFPDIKEVEDTIKFILETIEEKDKEHCEALKNSLTD